MNHIKSKSKISIVIRPLFAIAILLITPLAKGASCIITQSICPNYPTYVGTFEDYYGEGVLGASTNPAECMQRASDYYGWCGGAAGMNGTTTTANFLSGGVITQSTVVGGSCQITQAACPNYPTVVGTFEDVWGDQNLGASANPAECMQRASDYNAWCGLSGSGQLTTATYSSGGHVVESGSGGTYCQINQPSCPNHPYAPYNSGAFLDNYLNAGSNQAECMQRASDYNAWCGLSGSGETTTAYYVSGGKVVQLVTVGGGPPVPFSGNSILSAQVLLAGLYSVYSPAMIGNLLFSGGWLNSSSVGPDQLYGSQFNGSSWSFPAPLQWTNPGYTAGLVPGHHANDPSVIYMAQNNWYFMYYTALSNQYTSFNDITTHNWVGFASSTDGGSTWTDHGVIIGQYNGLDQTGAWSPSAIESSTNEIWLYYNTSSGEVLRTRLNMNGWQQIATNAVTNWNGTTLSMLNVDVQFAFGKYWMVGNSGLNGIALYLSDDGLKFYPYDGASGTLISGGPNYVLTPNLKVISPNSISVSFGFAPNDGNSTSINQWTFQLH